MFTFLVLGLVSSAKRLAGKNVSLITYLVFCGEWDVKP